jgi:hypothetical protein
VLRASAVNPELFFRAQNTNYAGVNADLSRITQKNPNKTLDIRIKKSYYTSAVMKDN